MTTSQSKAGSCRILALEPYYGGSHRAFIDDLAKFSRHQWVLISLPACHWKWRMRHAPITMADEILINGYGAADFDLIFCSDMLNLPEFFGLVDPSFQRLPSIVYFHENQLTYPNKREDERDLHFAFSNFTTAVRANEVWFNSLFHLRSFTTAMERFLRQVPSPNLSGHLPLMAKKYRVMPPGIREIPLGIRQSGRTPRVLWAARWEHDKNSELFFEAIRLLQKNTDLEFRLSILGESGAEIPESFALFRQEFDDLIDHFGFLRSRRAYEQVLADSDIVVSTALHEFFGLSVVESISAGAFPILPDRLSYPELLDSGKVDLTHHLYDGTVDDLAARLGSALKLIDSAEFNGARGNLAQMMEKYQWSNLIESYDRVLHDLALSQHSGFTS